VSAHDHDHHEHDHDHDHEHELDGEARQEVEAEARRRVALAQVRQYPDAALRLRANEVETVDDDVRRLAEQMTVLMHDAQGVGLAATQVGVLRRVFVFELDGEGTKVVVNPTLADHGTEVETDEEGCLSLQGVRVPVERPVSVVLEGKDEQGEDVRYELEGMPARVVQHELDHLDGVLIIDRTDDEHRKQALSVLRPRVVLR
jgi:peptide deformylase